jgi:hypothetical protein
MAFQTSSSWTEVAIINGKLEGKAQPKPPTGKIKLYIKNI